LGYADTESLLQLGTLKPVLSVLVLPPLALLVTAGEAGLTLIAKSRGGWMLLTISLVLWAIAASATSCGWLWHAARRAVRTDFCGSTRSRPGSDHCWLGGGLIPMRQSTAPRPRKPLRLRSYGISGS
jgi:hypothetical protein